MLLNFSALDVSGNSKSDVTVRMASYDILIARLASVERLLQVYS
jgi:hypothetical protein